MNEDEQCFDSNRRTATHLPHVWPLLSLFNRLSVFPEKLYYIPFFHRLKNVVLHVSNTLHEKSKGSILSLWNTHLLPPWGIYSRKNLICLKMLRYKLKSLKTSIWSLFSSHYKKNNSLKAHLLVHKPSYAKSRMFLIKLASLLGSKKIRKLNCSVSPQLVAFLRITFFSISITV